MAKKHEVVIIGGGHNGLTVAAYLAKAGVDVCVVEALPYIGGGVASAELATPGFKTDPCSVWHGVIQSNPLIRNDELDLQSKFGLEYINPERQLSVLFPDDSYISIHRNVDKTCETIAKFSDHDADAYKRFHEWSVKLLDVLIEGLFNPPPTFGKLFSLLEQSDEGRSLIRSLMISGVDICDDWFESPELKIALTKFCAEDLISPRTKGTGFVIFSFIPLMHKYGGGIAVGGSGALSEAMGRCILHYGGTILTSSPVESVIVTSGEAKGIVFKGGEEILAEKAVISNLHAKQIPLLVGAENVPETYAKNLRNLNLSSHRSICTGYALHEAPNFTGGNELNESCTVTFATRSYEEFLRIYDDYEYGYTHIEMPIITCQTRIDPTRAPSGKHTMHLFHHEPYELADGGAAKWDEIGEEIADGILSTLQKQTTNMGADNIIGRWIETPVGLERRNPAMIGGDYNHIGRYLHQMMGNRYLSGWDYKTPVERLWMCGPSTHPGGSVCGGGRAAVQAVMEELGIDFEKVISK